MKIGPRRSERVEQNEQKTSLLENQQTSKIVKKQTSKPVNQQTSKLVNLQTSKNALSTKEKTKYGTYLREDSILQIKVEAAQKKKKDHELLQDIVDYYFKNHK